MIRGKNYQLEQVVKRLVELENNSSVNTEPSDQLTRKSNSNLKTYFHKNFTISTKPGTNYFLSTGGDILKVTGLKLNSVNDNVPTLEARVFLSKQNCKGYPLQSDRIGVFELAGTLSVQRTYAVSDLVCKYVVLPCMSLKKPFESICFLLIHTL